MGFEAGRKGYREVSAWTAMRAVTGRSITDFWTIPDRIVNGFGKG
jgi:hypothetical protein